MSEADIRVNIRWIDRGMRQGAQQAQRSVRALGEAQRTAALQAIQLTQRIGAAANAIQSLTSRLGGSGSAAGLIGAFASSAAAGAQLGSALGPQGALVGGIVGALIPALEHLVPATEAAEDRMRRLDAAARAAAQGVRQAAAEAARQSSVSELLGRGIEGARAEDLDAIERALVETRARRAEIEAQITSEMRTGGREAADALERQHAAELRLLQSQERRLSSMRAVAQHAARVRAEDEASQRAAREEVERDRAAVQAEMELLEEQQRRREEARRQAAERLDLELEAWERYQDAIERGLDQQRRAQEEILRIRIESFEKAREEAQAIIDGELRAKRAREEAEQQRADALAAELERMRELGEEQRRLEEMRREAAIRTGREVMSVTEEIVGGIADTFAAIESGQKTAEEAYKALLARFLAFIAEKAALKALDEAAESIAAYARYDYSAGSQHAAAAVAFGALAVAAGVGSAVAGPQAGPPPGQSADARGIGDREDRGGTVVIEYNAPVVTAQTRSELGRDLDRMLGAGRRRFGSVAMER